MNQEEEYINIYPNLKRIINICKFKYTILEIKLFQSVHIAVNLYNENDLPVDTKLFLIEGKEYEAWSQDDKYIINLIKEKLNS